jgi:hypothetical protein
MTTVAQLRLLCCFVATAGELAHTSGPPGSAAWLDRSGACRGRMAVQLEGMPPQPPTGGLP